MMKRYATSAMALLFASAVAAGAQQVPPSSPQGEPQTPHAPQHPVPIARPDPSPSQQPAAGMSTMTLSGCLVREQDVPGRQPNVAERAGVLEDYILTSASIAGTGSSASAQAQTPVGTSGTQSRTISAMYKVEGIADNQLKTMVGKRVEITGKIDEDDARESAGSAGAATPRRPSDDLPEFEATSIREVPGTCAATVR